MPSPVVHSFELPSRPEDAAAVFLGRNHLGGNGFHVTTHTPTRIVYLRERRAVWEVPVCILLFPIGLLALVAGKEREVLTFDFQPAREDRSRVMVTGAASRRFAKAVREVTSSS